MGAHLPGLSYFLFGTPRDGAPVGGLALNLFLAAIALGGGSLLGVPIGLVRGLAPWWASAWLNVPLALIRSTPLLLLVLWLYLLIQAVLALPLAPVWIAAIALGLYSLTHISDIVRGGVKAVGEPALRSARSLGLTRIQICRNVIAPIALRAMSPALTSFATTLFKDTSVCYVIGVVELMQLGAFTVGRDPGMLLQTYALVGLLFFVVSAGGTQLAAALERRSRLKGMVAAGPG